MGGNGGKWGKMALGCPILWFTNQNLYADIPNAVMDMQIIGRSMGSGTDLKCDVEGKGKKEHFALWA